ncbi:hypothetical protein WN944_023704 [Citrus x changshan-huyou]|uniref:Uncharacterized protein n=1 Tax=Citrus x changshan-huyou TaxID=2935761 RepID=A0AAP0N0Q9_9ROSI
MTSILHSRSVVSLSFAQNADLKLTLKASNLGNCLVTEGWMKHSCFDGIPNKEVLVHN